jgi:hypothetical protein
VIAINRLTYKLGAAIIVCVLGGLIGHTAYGSIAENPNDGMCWTSGDGSVIGEVHLMGGSSGCNTFDPNHSGPGGGGGAAPGGNPTDNGTGDGNTGGEGNCSSVDPEPCTGNDTNGDNGHCSSADADPCNGNFCDPSNQSCDPPTGSCQDYGTCPTGDDPTCPPACQPWNPTTPSTPNPPSECSADPTVCMPDGGPSTG